MIEVPTPHYMERGHRFDAGPYLLDLYRLLCMELADRLVVKQAVKSPIFERLRGEHIEGESIRILTSTSIPLRILFDRRNKKRAGGRRHDDWHDKLLDEAKNADCGRLYARWPRKKSEVLTLREACNKIIHANTIHRDIAYAEPNHFRPYLYLYGKKDGLDWRAKLSIIAFAEHATTALIDPS